jgi:transposase
MTPPELTSEQRAAALQKAGEVRRERAVIKQRLKRGTMSAPEALAAGRNDDVIGKLRVTMLLESLPGIGKVRAAQIMKQVGIAPTRRIQGLGELQRAALLAELGYYPAPASRNGS